MSKYVPPHLRGSNSAAPDDKEGPQRKGSSLESYMSSGSGNGQGSYRRGQSGFTRQGSGQGSWRSGSSRWQDENGSREPGNRETWNAMRERTKNSSYLQRAGEPPSAPQHSENGEKNKILTKEELEQARKEREEAEKARHPDMFSVETTALQGFYTENSEVFRKWADVRSEGYTNEYIAHFFEAKNSNKQSSSKRAGAHEGADIGPIFTQFFKYAIDIDNGLGYTERAVDIANATGECWFLDFGFAPGGMADLLLNSHPNIKGVGVSLDPKEGGNVYLDSLNSHDRFKVCIGDVIDMAREDYDLKKNCNLPDDFIGFDFVIVGITIHQEWHGENMNELKDLLHFAQLYFALKYIKPGGMIMMRMHMSVRLVDCHFLALMLSLFNIEKFLGLESGRKRLQQLEEEFQTKKEEPEEPKKPLSSLDRLCAQMEQAGGPSKPLSPKETYGWNKFGCTGAATKPFSTFSMRKTFWTLWCGFDASEERRKEVMEKLQIVLGENVFAYGYNEEENRFNRPILLDMPIEELLSTYGTSMIQILEHVWNKQVTALQGFMVGLTDKMCRDGPSCRRRRCNMAHSPNEMIPEVYSALDAVNTRAAPRLRELHFL